MDATTIIRYIGVVVYGGVFFAAWRLHSRARSVGSRWLVATFGVLFVVVLSSVTLPESGPDAPLWRRVVADVAIAVLLLFPYFLFRFAAAFTSPPRVMEWISAGWFALLAMWTFVSPPLPGAGEDLNAGQLAYLLAILSYWAVVSLWVVAVLWRGGRGQARVARGRMRLLAAGTLLMTFTILLAGVRFPQGSALALVVQVLGWSSAAVFLVGFWPPGGLRHAWRQADERRLRRAEADLMVATTAHEVAQTIVPHAATMLGGHGAALVDSDGGVLAAQGFTPGQVSQFAAAQVETITEDRLVLPLRTGCLVVEASAYAPFFGTEELELLRSLGTFIDLALSRIHLHEQDAVTRKELERTNEELVALVYGISHDLRSPIVTVIGYLELLSTDAQRQLSDEARHYLERISVSARYMDSLIRDLLELSRIGRAQTDAEPIELTALIEDIAAELRRNHPATRFVVDRMPVVTMNSVRARQLFTNLMENAVRHGGRDDITVTVSAAPWGEDGVAVSVADDGVGIPEPYRDRVFGIFERLDSEVSNPSVGTGIGLAMCRKIVDQLDGEIWIEEAPVGTTFTIGIPATATTQSLQDVEVQRQ